MGRIFSQIENLTEPLLVPHKIMYGCFWRIWLSRSPGGCRSQWVSWQPNCKHLVV